MKRRNRGFTLMELMVVLTIAAIIVGLGAPNFNRFRLNSRLTNSANDVLASLIAARTDAIKTQVTVSICASANPSDPAATCTNGSNVGWVAFRDVDGNCLRSAASEPIVSSGTFDNTFSSQPLFIKVNGNCVSFASTGFTRTAAGVAMTDHFLMCDNRGIAALPDAGMLSAGRGIVVDRTGRSRITRAVTGGLADDLTTWGGMAGVALACP
jgi:type IV fimbrial biogenesis protein FimT